jgi:hypothetical protein
MLRILCAAIVSWFLISTSSYAQTVGTGSLSGSFYQYVPGKPAPAFPGLRIYVALLINASDPNAGVGAWIGPSLTDNFGRFTFGGLPAGIYLLRAFSGKQRVWEADSAVSGTARTLAPIVIAVHDPSTTIIYYAKPVDEQKVRSKLTALGFAFVEHPAKSKSATDTVWFGDAVALADVKLVACALIEGGVRIRAVRRLPDGGGIKKTEIQIGAMTGVDSKSIMTVQQIESANDFPRG